MKKVVDQRLIRLPTWAGKLFVEIGLRIVIDRGTVA